VAKQEIDAAQRLDKRNAMVEMALSELMLKQAYYSGDAFKASSYNAAGLNNALQHAKNAVEYSPENALSLAQLAKVLLIHGQKDAFLEVLRQMHQVAPGTFYPWYLQAVLARKLNNVPRVQQAIAEAEKFTETNYQKKGLEEERKYLARKQGDIVAEERSYKTLIQLEPNSAHAHGNYGGFLHRNKRYEEAIAALNKAISIQPYPMALELLAKAESAKRL
jgi:Tfp pilus assembly protein PilF